MAEPTSDAISSTEHSDVDVKDAGENQIAATQNRPEVSRGFSEWEAIQIAAAGDNDTIDREIAEIEASLAAMNIKSTWFKPQLKLSNPKHFTFLLVGKYQYPRDCSITNSHSFCFHGGPTLWCRSIFNQWCQPVHA